MTDFETQDHELHWEVFVTPSIPAKTRNLPPGTTQLLWSPTSATLIYGKREAVPVDALLTIEQAHSLGEWVAAQGKHLTTIYLTHGHGDHCFGAGTLLKRYPDRVNPGAIWASARAIKP
jgi:glyoxylase-like metal-dependent hydrolase (beta-lactamase superfamily II)